MFPVTTTEHLSSSVASSEKLVPSSTVLETSATTTEFVLATSTRVETQVETQIATKPTELT
jgi:hypothetical protein